MELSSQNTFTGKHGVQCATVTQYQTWFGAHPYHVGFVIGAKVSTVKKIASDCKCYIRIQDPNSYSKGFPWFLIKGNVMDNICEAYHRLDKEAKIMMKGKAKKEVDKKSSEEVKKEREEYEVSSGLAEKRASLEILKNQIKELEEARSDLYKKGRGVNPASKEELAKRFKANKDNSSKNLFCKHGDGVNGELEEKHGGKKITGCGYICRSVKTMEKHLLSCKYASGGKKK